MCLRTRWAPFRQCPCGTCIICSSWTWTITEYRVCMRAHLTVSIRWRFSPCMRTKSPMSIRQPSRVWKSESQTHIHSIQGMYLRVVSTPPPHFLIWLSLWVYLTASRFLYNVRSSFLFLFVPHPSTHSTVVVFANVFVFTDVSIVYSRWFPCSDGNWYLLVE